MLMALVLTDLSLQSMLSKEPEVGEEEWAGLSLFCLDLGKRVSTLDNGDMFLVLVGRCKLSDSLIEFLKAIRTSIII